MKKVWRVVAFTVLFALIYNLAPLWNVPIEALAVGFVLAPFIILYMVWVVLRYGKPSRHTFNDRYYEDIP